MRDFIPYAVAVRIRNTIEFTLKLAARASELNISHSDEQKLAQIDIERKVFNDRWEEKLMNTSQHKF